MMDDGASFDAGVSAWISCIFWLSTLSNRQNSRILRHVLAGHWFSENAKNLAMGLFQ